MSRRKCRHPVFARKLAAERPARKLCEHNWIFTGRGGIACTLCPATGQLIKE